MLLIARISRLKLIGIAGCLVIAACGGASEQSSLNSARTYLDKQDSKAAIIEIKNALQKNPDSAEARFLLGRSLYESGDAGAALVELRKAVELHHPDAIVLPLLARALNATGQYKLLVEKYASESLSDAAASAELKSSVALAFAALGDRARAEEELAAALAAAPQSIPAQLLDARFKAGRGDIDAASRRVDEVLARAPANDAAWLLKGELLWRGRADLQGALEAYRKALSARKNSMPAHSATISLLLELKRVDEAAKQLDELKQYWPNHPQTLWYASRIALVKGDLPRVRALVEQILAVYPDDARALYLKGVAEYAAGAIVQAQRSFAKALHADPDELATRRMLARTELRLGQAARAIAVIQPAIESEGGDAESLSIAAQAQLMNGDSAKAEQLFALANKADPNDVKTRTALALAKISRGKATEGLGDLRALAASEKGVNADLGLIHALMFRRDFDGAIAAIDKIQQKDVSSPTPWYLRGMALLGKADRPAAIAAFERALAVDPKHFPSADRLARLDLADKKPEAAKKRFDSVLAADPRQLQAMLALADLRALAGGSTQEVAALIESAIAANPTEPQVRVRLVGHYIAAGDVKAALAAAQRAVVVFPDEYQVLTILGRAQLVAGELNQAAATFSKIATAQPESAVPLLRLAEVKIAAGDDDGAIQTLRRALTLAPKSMDITRTLIFRLLASGHPADALAVARNTQKINEQSALGHVFEGDIEASRKNFSAAAAAYRRALTKAKSTEIAVKLYSVLLDAKQAGDGEKVANDWLREYPRDIVFMLHAGDKAMLLKNYPIAESRYRSALELDPKQLSAINNLAWALYQMNKPGALELTEKANRLKPDQPELMDTMATILAANGQLSKALGVQKKAIELQPDSSILRLHLADLYIRGGDKGAARSELERLAKLGDKVPEREEVARLLKSL